MIRLIASALSLLLVLAPAYAAPSAPTRQADLVLLGGKVFTADPAQPWATAVAVSGERVLAVGDDAAMRALTGPRTRVIELGGRVVIPGFNDAHRHVGADGGGVAPDFGKPDPSMDTVLDALTRTVAQTPRGTWILNWKISTTVLDSPSPRDALDRVAPDNPVMLTADTDHGSVLNSAALRALGYGEETPDPPGGLFVRAGDGRLTGVLLEYASLNAQMRLVARRPDVVHSAALREAAAEALASGITSIQDMADTALPDQTLCAVRDVNPALRLRVIRMPTIDAEDGLAKWQAAERTTPLPTNGTARVAGVKWVLDGTPLERQAALRAPYSDRPETSGRLNFSDDEIRARLRAALAQPPGADQQLMFHTCGDASAEQVLRLMQELAPAEVWRARRVRLEHAEGLFTDLLPLARELGVIVVENPTHFADDPSDLSRRRLGPERVRQYQPLRSILRAGIPLALGSDGPLNPFLNLMFATTHPNNPGEAISREAAVTAYTHGSAYAEFAEHDKGRLAPGQLADLAVLSQDIFTVDADTLPTTTSVLTLVGGRVTHDAGVLASPPTTTSATVNAIADRYVAAYFDAHPDYATEAGAAAGPHDRLPDLSLAARTAWQGKEDAIHAELESLDATRLPAGSADAVTYGFLKEWVRNDRALRICRMEWWNVSPTMNGWLATITSLPSLQPLGSAEKDAAALRRFAQLPRYVDQDIANLRAGLAHDHSAPKVSVHAVIKQLDGLLAAPIAESPFVAMAPAGDADLRARLEALESSAIRPALIRYRDFLRNEYLAKARDEVGVSANPDGAACYRAAVRYYSTVDIAPEAVHRTGLEQMQKIHGEMRTLAERSFGTSDVDAVLKRLKTERRYLFSGREEMLSVAATAASRAQHALPRWFGILPHAGMKIEPAPAFSDDDAYYNPPAEDGSRPGIFYVNLNRAEREPRAGLESSTFHEGYPGHHLQMTIASERRGLHPVSRYFVLSGFNEGWGLYSEELADEMGLFTSDVDRMGRLSWAAVRAARLVVDSGIHALGWSRPQAIDYMLANTALSPESAKIEIDRYIAWPGQATSYMLGNLEIRHLRGMAEARLGRVFDIRAFHDKVLEDGAVPLAMLRAKIERWLEQGGKAGS